MDEGEIAALKNRIRALELGQMRIRGHLIGTLAEMDRALQMSDRSRKLAAEALAQLELATPRPKPAIPSRRRPGTTTPDP